MIFPFSLSPLQKWGNLGTSSVYLLQHLASIPAGLMEHPPGCWCGTQALAGYDRCHRQPTSHIWEAKLMEKPEQHTKSCLHHPGTSKVLHHPPPQQLLGSASTGPRGRYPPTNLFPPLSRFPGWQLTQLPASKPGQATRGRVKAPYLLQHFLFSGSL